MDLQAETTDGCCSLETPPPHTTPPPNRALSWIQKESGSNERLEKLPGAAKREPRVEEMNNQCQEQRQNREELPVSSTSRVSIIISRRAGAALTEVDDTAISLGFTGAMRLFSFFPLNRRRIFFVEMCDSSLMLHTGLHL